MAPASSFLTAQWRDLAMLNFVVDPAAISGLVPVGTELDAWNGTTFVSLVGFRFLDTRILGVPIPGHRDFDEVNLRFYVRRQADDGWRRGVVFVKEIVPRKAIAWIARAVYNEQYVALPMRHQIVAPRDDRPAPGRARYEWRYRGRWQRLTLDFEGHAVLPSESSPERFITEHYWGYARQRDGATVEYQVEHPRWAVSRATDASVTCDVSELYGARFSPFLRSTPTSAFLAEGSAVTVRRPTVIGAQVGPRRP
jgi:uncharacterized protein